MGWKSLPEGYLGPKITNVNEVLNINDIIYVTKKIKNVQVTASSKINGGIVVMDPHTGRVFAMWRFWI